MDPIFKQFFALFLAACGRDAQAKPLPCVCEDDLERYPDHSCSGYVFDGHGYAKADS